MNPEHRHKLAIKSLVVKRSVKISGHKTSVSLEDDFWHALWEIAASESTSVQALVTKIDKAKRHSNLSSAIRLYVLRFYIDRRGAKT